MYQLWKNKNGRFYEISLERDLFDIVVRVSWGSIRKKPKTKTLGVFKQYDEATQLIMELEQVRMKHQYELVEKRKEF
jgi:predicted DNA-binding WGR domain protein